MTNLCIRSHMFHLSLRRWDGSLIANCQSIFLPIGLLAGFTHGSAKSSDSACLRQTFSLKKPAEKVRVVGFLTLVNGDKQRQVEFIKWIGARPKITYSKVCCRVDCIEIIYPMITSTNNGLNSWILLGVDCLVWNLTALRECVCKFAVCC